MLKPTIRAVIAKEAKGRAVPARKAYHLASALFFTGCRYQEGLQRTTQTRLRALFGFAVFQPSVQFAAAGRLYALRGRGAHRAWVAPLRSHDPPQPGGKGFARNPGRSPQFAVNSHQILQSRDRWRRDTYSRETQTPEPKPHCAYRDRCHRLGKHWRTGRGAAGASSRDVWTVPLGGGFGKIIHAGKLPINLSVQAFYNVATPRYGADSRSIRLQCQLLFPK